MAAKKQKLRDAVVFIQTEFLAPAGLLTGLRSVGMFADLVGTEESILQVLRQVERTVLRGNIVTADHPAGLWLAAPNMPEYQLMIPWRFVVALAIIQSEDNKVFGYSMDAHAAHLQKQLDHK